MDLLVAERRCVCMPDLALLEFGMEETALV